MTGDREVDALLWLRDVIATGHPGHIERAMQAAERIKTPLKELEKRYSKFLDITNPGSFLAPFAAYGLANLQSQAETATLRAATKARALAIFGNERDLFERHPAEQFCVDVLRGIKADKLGFLDEKQTAKRFDAKPEQRPQTLADCLHELAFWDGLYELRAAFAPTDHEPEASAREDYVFALLAKIRPRGSDEALAVLRCLADRDRMERAEAAGILENLIA